MRTYEMVLVFDPALEVEQIESDLQKWNEFITQYGLPRRWERWGATRDPRRGRPGAGARPRPAPRRAASRTGRPVRGCE